MGWERRGSQRYYYRSRRLPCGKVVKDYFGRGPAAEQAAREDAEKRQERERCRQRRKRLDQAIVPLKAVEEHLDALVTATLLANGYDRCNSAWRRKRNGSNHGKTKASKAVRATDA